MKKLINKFAKWLLQKTCDHKNTEFKHECIQDKYIYSVCKDCGKEIWTNTD